jgi:hypothetical protein
MIKATLLFMAFAGTAFAQGTPVKLEWPRSFTGQPDFAFTRDEAFAEARARAARENTPTPTFPSLLLIATDETVPDPLRLKMQGTNPTINTLGEEISATVVSGSISLLDKLLGNMQGLPSYATPSTVQAGEYRGSIQSLISQTVANWKPDANRYDFSAALETLVLQAVVTSPQQYAVINGTRYTVGSSFLLRVPLMVPDMEIMEALDAAAPDGMGLDEVTLKAYAEVREEALAAFAAARNRTPAVGQKVLNIPVVVERIEPRRVMLNVNGQQKPLAVKYAY